MEMPLTLHKRRDGALVASLPAAYRAATAAVLFLLILALALGGDAPPGLIGWIALIATSLAAFYEERWVFDPSTGNIVHRTGLVFLARRTTIILGDVTRVHLAPFVRGTVPGSADEAVENAAALAGGRADDMSRRRASYKKHYLCILIETKDGSRYFVDAGSPRSASTIKVRASRIAEACGAPLVEG